MSMSGAPSCGTLEMLHSQRMALLTDGVDEVVEGAVREEGLGELPEEHLEGSCGNVDVLPLTVIQVHLLIWWMGADDIERKDSWLYPTHVLGILGVTYLTFGLLPWFTAKRSFWITARFPLTLYKPSTLRPAAGEERNTVGPVDKGGLFFKHYAFPQTHHSF